MFPSNAIYENVRAYAGVVNLSSRKFNLCADWFLTETGD